MKPINRRTALMLSTAAVIAASITGSATAAYWSLLSNTNGQNAQPATRAGTAVASGDVGNQLATSGTHYRDGSYTGPIVDAYYGQVQVQADIQGGRLMSVHLLQYPADQWTSRSINAQALPMLESEVISKQSAWVDIISGATLTSVAYLRSLDAALRQAGA